MKLRKRLETIVVRMVALFLTTTLSVSTFTPVSALAQSLPREWEIVAGAAQITSDETAMTVHQTSDSLITNWESFSIGKNASVTFVQPDANSVALNRVTGASPSEILGRLSANGRVFLVNPRGIVFGQDARIDTTALIASTLDISDEAFLQRRYAFAAEGSASIASEDGAPGAIANHGDLRGGVIALIAPVVQNHGTITGDALLTGGTDVFLDLDGNNLIGIRIDAATVETLVENHGLIQADGGTVVLTARAAGEALGGIVNNTGVIEARRFEERDGRILLVGDMVHGSVHADGQLTAPFVETSAATVTASESLMVDATGGEWVIDPVNITIDESLAAAINFALNLTTVIISTSPVGFQLINTASRETPGPGDIIVNAPITWSKHILLLEADRHIIINAELTSKGTTENDGLFLRYGITDPTGDYFINNKVNLAPGSSFRTRKGNEPLKVFTIITSLGTQNSYNDGTLQGIRGNPTGYFALGADIDASATANWKGAEAFEPIGWTYGNEFRGIFEGLGHTIYNLHINREPYSGVGLFSALKGVVQNVGIVGASVKGARGVGVLAGSAEAGALIKNVYVDGSASITGDVVGGLVGYLRGGRIENSRSLVNVQGGKDVGGLVGSGYDNSIILGSYAAGNVKGTGSTGGLVGYMFDGRIESSLALGNVTGWGDAVGGLVGYGYNVTIHQSGATGNVNMFASSGWDLQNVWSAQPSYDNGLLALRWQEHTRLAPWPPGGVRLIPPGSSLREADPREIGVILSTVQRPSGHQPELTGCSPDLSPGLPPGLIVIDEETPPTPPENNLCSVLG